MVKALKLAVATLAIVGGGSNAMAWPGFQDYTVYTYTFYSDASHTNVVGIGQTRCDGRTDYSGSYYMRWGSQSSYYDQDEAGICTEHGLAPDPN